MSADLVKAFFTYATALLVVLGGLLVLFASRLEPGASQLQVIVAGFIGSALTFLFVQENSTRASRAAERQIKAGSDAANATTPTVTTAGGPSVTVTPNE